VRSRSLFVRHAPFRAFRAFRGLLGPLAIAVTLAVAGHQLAAAPAPARANAVSPFQTERPEVRRSTTTRANAVARQAPPRPRQHRATRSRPRTGWVRPAGGPLTSRFGYRWGKLHKGIDLGASYGSPIYAASAGVVTYAGSYAGYGRLVTVRHGKGITTAYGHMSRIAVRSGQHVEAGQVIAYVGSEGHSTGPHLHFEVRTARGVIDPLPFLRSRGVRV
jgi:murein DD-endopeptidase MepM/ murein hydrolase activator NlpD